MSQHRGMLQRIVFVGVVAVAFTLTGCTSEAQPSPDQGDSVAPPPADFEYLTEGSAFDEYLATIAAIPEPMPAGVNFPEGLPANFVPEPEEGYLQNGAARNQAWFTWLCAWENEYVEAFTADDADRLSLAEAMISRWPEMDFYKNVVEDEGQSWVSFVVTPMTLGDPSGVKLNYKAMCSVYPTVEAK